MYSLTEELINARRLGFVVTLSDEPDGIVVNLSTEPGIVPRHGVQRRLSPDVRIADEAADAAVAFTVWDLCQKRIPQLIGQQRNEQPKTKSLMEAIHGATKDRLVVTFYQHSPHEIIVRATNHAGSRGIEEPIDLDEAKHLFASLDDAGRIALGRAVDAMKRPSTATQG